MPERESLDVDALIVGAGPAGLAAAIRLKRLLGEAGRGDATVLVLEKGSEPGRHILSGCVMDPIGIRELIPDFLAKGAPIEAEVTSEAVYFLTRKWRFPIPTPPPMRNHGNLIVALGHLVKWLAARAEEVGVEVYPEFPGAEPLVEGGRVVGIRTGDKGTGKDGKPKGSYQPGMDVRAPVTILAEGSRGSLTKALVERLGLGGRHPQAYATGVKEIWKLPAGRFPRGHVVHTMGFPLDRETFGGSFVYGLSGDRISLGFVVGLDYRDPTTDPHRLLQEFKTHPWMRGVLEGGELVSYGAKTIPEGGLYAMPRLYADGLLLAGDSAGFLNSARLKGVHLAIKSGMLAAEAAAAAIVGGDPSAARLARVEDLFRDSWAWRELRRVRNFHQGFRGGFYRGLMHASLQFATGGRGLWKDPLPAGPDHERMETLSRRFGDGGPAPRPKIADGQLTFDKVSDLYVSGTGHEEDQPVHLRVADLDLCASRCAVEYGNPCQNFCPANVYEMVEAPGGGRRLQINAANCVHCKTCDIMDPYQVITWVTPEGGGGPSYDGM